MFKSQISRENMLLMLILFVGYTMIVYVRESVTYSAPAIIDAERLSNSDLGLIVSAQKMGYALIKLAGGTMVDVLDPSCVFIASLALTGVTGMIFTACSSVTMFSLTWFVSGLVQGPSWPACALLLRKSSLSNQFAFWWSILSTSSNVASTLGPLISQALNKMHPWRVSFVSVGVLSIIVAVVGGFYLMYFQRKKALENGDTKKVEAKESEPLSVRALLNPVMFTVFLDYFLFSVVRGACNDWSQHYVIQDKKQSVLIGSQFISSQEVGGIFGSVVAGYFSDVTIPKLQHQAMPRLKTQFVFSFLLTVGLFCLIFMVNHQSSQIWIHSVGFVIGFALYGCITLIGVISMDVAPSHLTGTAHSLSTLAANFGRLAAAYPLTLVATYYAWHESFLISLTVSCLSVVISYMLIHMVEQKHQTEVEKKDT